jgi:outer membrane receptor protein involved in Fe transport
MLNMRKGNLLGATALVLLAAAPAWAQETSSGPVQSGGATSGTTQSADSLEGPVGEIVVTAQRQAQRLQDVPISVSAFTAEALQEQQIENPLDLQLSLPNITFTKTNFTASSFTIRGIGDLCVGFSCDTATAVHINDQPSIVRLFEAEFFDLERIEVLRGPQGTLFGRNATSGVVNFITARPNLSRFQASGFAEYGNYESIRVQGMVNVPIGETFGARLAGYYLKRDGYTDNLFTGRKDDDRDLYAIRGTLRWEPSDSTTLDLIGYYFREKDNRNRIQKQLCNRDPTGILGCSPDRLENEVLNGNATLAGILTSREFVSVALSPALAPFAWGSLYGTDLFSNAVNPASVRQIASDFRPTYYARDWLVQGRLEQAIGDTLNLTVTGGYQDSKVDSRTDYNLAVPNDLTTNAGIAAFRSFPVAAGLASKLFQGTNICTSEANTDYSGVYGGNVFGCSPRSIDYDRSRGHTRGYSIEGQVASDFEGPINFLVGGIYLNTKVDGDYFVNSAGLDYGSALIGLATSLNPLAGLTPGSAYQASPFFNSETNRFRLKSYGLYGEAYVDLSDRLKLTMGVRYSNDKKFVRDRNPLVNFPALLTNATPFNPPPSSYDADAGTPGNQPFREARVGFDELTGRVVLDWKPWDDTLFYLSLSRGYKSGGINPPFNAALFTAPATFRPEIIKAIEIGTKNTFGNGMVQLNANVFYYDYKDLQLSRILNRTSFNDNTDATIYGAEIEAVLRPVRALTMNFNASYLRTKIKDLQLVDTRDPSGGRSDTVIIKDITNAANCVVTPTTAGDPRAALLVGAFNQGLSASLGSPGLLRAPTPVPGTNATGAYSVCSALAATIANPSAPLRALFGTPTGPLPFLFNTNAAGAPTGLPDGNPVDLSGNSLPQAPKWKFSAGIQYEFAFDNGMSLVPRADLTYTGDFFARSFNRPIDRVNGYEVVNAQIQLNGPDERWFVRGFIQNLTKNNAVTGQYVTDQSSGLFTNIFTLEPRRYGIAAGFKF